MSNNPYDPNPTLTATAGNQSAASQVTITA